MRLLLTAALCALPALAAAEAGLTGGVTLSRPLGARAEAMGGAFSAVEGGLDSLTYNPAGLARLSRPELRFDYTHGIVDDSFGFLGYARRLSAFTLAGGAAYYDAGTIDLNLSDGTKGRRKAEQDWLGLLSAAVALPARLSAAATLKYYHFSLAQAASASGLAFDAGLRWATPLPGLSAGAALQNLGSAVKFEQQGDPLPRTERAGLAYSIGRRSPDPEQDADVGFDRFLLTGDVVSVLDQPLAAASGLEMRVPLGGSDYAALRFGYLFNSSDSFSMGIGIREGRYVFDYALGLARALGSAHHFSIGLRL
ncbi:MAG: PorV/PorQ family protein [Elusimicrobia bacterium]|nr:PorV/PorQ family protein [Elusimicrobiota bacterium]MDE2237034.1 PorV/PorQ family protein [Elusimicrobiota bacterium]MDE2425115.1 PorV/PorQ family protein [Elusimicrobiota bacterium]